MKASFVGEIAVVEFQPGERKQLGKFAKQLLREHKNLKTVAVKSSITEGKYRVRKIKVIAGKKTTETIYKENACVFKFDLNKVYFSPRLAFERQRIAALAKPGEKILVLFAGVGPYAIVIAKKLALEKRVNGTEITGVELNPAGVKYFQENIELNKVSVIVEVVKADAKKFLAKKENTGKFDRIIMPLPKSAHEFLDGAVRCCRKGGVIHFYAIASELAKNVFENAEKQVMQACKKQKRKCKTSLERVVLPYAPRVVQIAVDFRVS